MKFNASYFIILIVFGCMLVSCKKDNPVYAAKGEISGYYQLFLDSSQVITFHSASAPKPEYSRSSAVASLVLRVYNNEPQTISITHDNYVVWKNNLNSNPCNCFLTQVKFDPVTGILTTAPFHVYVNYNTLFVPYVTPLNEESIWESRYQNDIRGFVFSKIGSFTNNGVRDTFVTYYHISRVVD